MRITVVGATGQIGAQVVELLTGAGHDVDAAARSSGVDAVSGDGVAAAFDGADAVVDVLNSPTLEPGPAADFFTASATTLLAAAKKAGVQHYVVLSIVGVGSIDADGYLQGKQRQEELVANSGVPYTIVRATQFHELTEIIAGSLVAEGVAHAPDALIQPVAAAEVADLVARVATEVPRNDVLNFGGPEKMSFADLARAVFTARGEDITVVIDPQATYFGVPVQRNSLVTDDGAELGTTRLSDWLDR
ncbi:LysR family transcriptional regulator [Mycolicibacterium cosmeticum]|uniref:dTDP-4-dehydrorhamnose reductase n=1 Tax=Mycolicibacterium cosmeticum TaxID=258533 RepID=W9BKM7_MYCCO|nr:NAD(P)H-binding protein [Mycolicibacterium cosmeticum]TLH71831.1 LysR family transcriptional regulator [Mycolicibacterium cosmeticum]CDO08170.1 dTDP-4-dehydrorhamnose reductase [Mycolicibacterium cosmeticum]